MKSAYDKKNLVHICIVYTSEGRTLVIKNVISSISNKNSGTPWLRDSVIPWLRDFSFFLSNTFVYELILLKLSTNAIANIVKMQIFQKIKFDLRDHSRSQIMTFLIKNHLFFFLCYWLIEKTNATEYYEKTKFDLYKDDICLILTLTYVLIDNFLSLFFL